MPFELPRSYPQEVQNDLCENRLTKRSRAKFIARICSAIFRYKAFPSTAEYNHVGEQIVKKYPFLRNKTGTGYISSSINHVLNHSMHVSYNGLPG